MDTGDTQVKQRKEKIRLARDMVRDYKRMKWGEIVRKDVNLALRRLQELRDWEMYLSWLRNG